MRAQFYFPPEKNPCLRACNEQQVFGDVSWHRALPNAQRRTDFWLVCQQLHAFPAFLLFFIVYGFGGVRVRACHMTFQGALGREVASMWRSREPNKQALRLSDLSV